MRSRYQKLKAERDNRRAYLNQIKSQKAAILEGMVNIPLDQRMQLDQQLKTRGRGSRDPKDINSKLNSVGWEDPVVDTKTGEIINLNRVDPRRKLPSALDTKTGKPFADEGVQQGRLAKAMSGNVDAILKERNVLDKHRNLRTRGFMTPHMGTHPRGLSRVDTDLLDAAALKDAGIKDFKGTPIDEAIEQLGGEANLETAKVLKESTNQKKFIEQHSLNT